MDILLQGIKWNKWYLLISYFSKGNSCKCIQPDSDQGALQNAEQCNFTCDGEAICGGDNAISIYEKGNDFLDDSCD